MGKEFIAKYVVVWTDGIVTTFYRKIDLINYINMCEKDELCQDLECKVFHIENNKIEEINL